MVDSAFLLRKRTFGGKSKSKSPMISNVASDRSAVVVDRTSALQTCSTGMRLAPPGIVQLRNRAITSVLPTAPSESSAPTGTELHGVSVITFLSEVFASAPLDSGAPARS